MTKPKTGKSAADIFASTTKPKAKPTKAGSRAKTEAAPPGNVARGRGRPPVHEEDWTKVTVVLMNRQIVFLDRLATDIRMKTGKVVKRAEMIRAMIDAVEGADIDLTAAGSEADIRAAVQAKMR